MNAPFIERRRPHPMPRARRVLMVLIILGLLAGFASLVWLIAELRLLMDKTRIPTHEDLERAALAFKVLSVLMSLSVLGMATWIGHFAWRVHRAEVYPPPGSRHIQVKRVRKGKESLRVAYACYFLTVLLAAAGFTIAPMAFHIMRTLGL